MSYYSMTGAIYLDKIISYEEIYHEASGTSSEQMTDFSYNNITDFSYFLLEKAISSRLGLNQYLCLTESAMEKYPIKDYLKDGYLPFEITDAPWSCDCHKIFANRYYGYYSVSYTMEDILETRLPDVEKFLCDIIEHKNVSYITFEVFEIHEEPIEYTECEIKANQFCQTIFNCLENRYDMPALKLKIIK